MMFCLNYLLGSFECCFTYLFLPNDMISIMDFNLVYYMDVWTLHSGVILLMRIWASFLYNRLVTLFTVQQVIQIQMSTYLDIDVYLHCLFNLLDFQIWNILVLFYSIGMWVVPQCATNKDKIRHVTAIFASDGTLFLSVLTCITYP